MPTITIDEEIVEVAQEMLLAYFDIMYFLEKHAELYSVFNSYTGSAKSEVSEYSQQQLKQMMILGMGYSGLAKEIKIIVDTFLKFDDKKAAFYESMTSKMSADVLKSLGT